MKILIAFPYLEKIKHHYSLKNKKQRPIFSVTFFGKIQFLFISTVLLTIGFEVANGGKLLKKLNKVLNY
jgi:hypothetical protein